MFLYVNGIGADRGNHKKGRKSMKNAEGKERKRSGRKACVADKPVEKKRGRGKEEERQKEGRTKPRSPLTRDEK